jgi:hypothetical protein
MVIGQFHLRLLSSRVWFIVCSIQVGYGYVPRRRRMASPSGGGGGSNMDSSSSTRASTSHGRTSAASSSSSSKSLPTSVRPTARRLLSPVSRSTPVSRALSAGPISPMKITLNGSASASLPLVLSPPSVPSSSSSLFNSHTGNNNNNNIANVNEHSNTNGNRSPLSRGAHHAARMRPASISPVLPLSSNNSNIDPFTTISDALQWPNAPLPNIASLPPLPVWNAPPMNGDIPISARKPKEGMVVFIDRNGTPSRLTPLNRNGYSGYNNNNDTSSLSSRESSRSITPLQFNMPSSTTVSPSLSSSIASSLPPPIHVSSSSIASSLMFIPTSPPLVSMTSPGGTPLPPASASRGTWSRSPSHVTRSIPSSATVATSVPFLSPIVPTSSLPSNASASPSLTVTLQAPSSHLSSLLLSSTPSQQAINRGGLDGAAGEWSAEETDALLARVASDAAAASMSRQLRSNMTTSLGHARQAMSHAQYQHHHCHRHPHQVQLMNQS